MFSPTEDEVRDALGRLDPLWDELLPGDQERIVRLLVERVDLTDAGAPIRLNLEGAGRYGTGHGGEGGDRGMTSVTVVVPMTIRRRGGRVLNLTLLAPRLLEAILDGWDPKGTTPQLLAKIEVDWWSQRKASGPGCASACCGLDKGGSVFAPSL